MESLYRETIRGIIILGILILMYPLLLDNIYYWYIDHYKHNISQAERGTFGDMYGMLNSILSGLTVIGIVFTLYWSKIQEEEKVKKEMKDKMIYLEAIFQEGLSISKSYISSFEKFKEDLKINEFYDIPNLKLGRSYTRLSLINEKIDQEKYFMAYSTLIEGSDVLTAFTNFENISIKCSQTVQDIEDKNLRDRQRKINLLDSFNIIPKFP